MARNGGSVNLVLGFSSVCLIVGVILTFMDQGKFGGLLIAIAVGIVILSMWWGRKGAA